MWDKITTKMCKYKIISSNETEYMKYALILLYEKWISILSCLIIAAYFHCVFEMILFLLFFCNLRKYTGGFHLKSFIACYSISMLYALCIVYTVAYLLPTKFILFLILIASDFVILLIGAINHPNMMWDKKEEKESKRKARCVVITETLMICLMTLVGVNVKIVSCAILGEMSCAMLLLLAKCFGQEVKADE